MQLGALGTVVWDRVVHPDGRPPVEQWGGMVYALSGLAAARPEGWTIRPLLRLGADLGPSALDYLARLPGVDPGPGVRLVPEPVNRVELRYLDAAERTERLSGGVVGFRWDELEPRVRPLDALYLNFVSGRELDLDTLRRLRAAFHGPIYADLHSLFLGPPGDGPRRPVPLPRWREWLACVDVVQLNQSELALLAGPGKPDPARLLEFGPALAVVTLGAGGARYASRGDPILANRGPSTGAVKTGVVAPPDGPLEGDPTGCGDVWGSVFWCGLLGGLPPREAVGRAHRLAGEKIRHPATDGLHLRLRAALG